MLGVIRIWPPIRNFFLKSRYRLTPVELKPGKTYVRRLWMLRNDEEKLAEKIYESLQSKELNDHELCTEIGNQIRELRSPKSYCFKPSRITQDQDPQMAIDQYLRAEGNPVIYIHGKKYHIKYIYSYVKNCINRSKSPNKRLKELIQRFKGEMAKEYTANIPLANDCKDAWMRCTPDLDTFKLEDYHDRIVTFLEKKEEAGLFDAFCSDLQLEKWKDLAIRVDSERDIRQLKVIHKTKYSCRSWWKEEVQEWHYKGWLDVEFLNDEMVFTINSSNVPSEEQFVLQVYGKWNILKSEYAITHSLRQGEIKQRAEEEKDDFDSIILSPRSKLNGTYIEEAKIEVDFNNHEIAENPGSKLMQRFREKLK